MGPHIVLGSLVAQAAPVGRAVERADKLGLAHTQSDMAPAAAADLLAVLLAHRLGQRAGLVVGPPQQPDLERPLAMRLRRHVQVRVELAERVHLLLDLMA